MLHIIIVISMANKIDKLFILQLNDSNSTSSFYPQNSQPKIVKNFMHTVQKMLSYSRPNSMGPLSTFRTFASEFSPIDMTFSKYVTIRFKCHSLLVQIFTSLNFGQSAEPLLFWPNCQLTNVFADILDSFDST